MKSLRIISTVVFLALSNVVSAEGELSPCSKKITDQGYSCCPINCKVYYTDEDGTWGVHNHQWCGCGIVDGDDNQTEIETEIETVTEFETEIETETITEYETEIETDLIDDYNKRVEEIMADDKEIERKWLLNKENIPYNLTDPSIKASKIKQTYICFDPEMRVREYTDVNKGEISYEMTIKNNMSQDGLVRDEINIDINEEQYNNLVIKKEGNVIYKTRYDFMENGLGISIDIYQDDLEGLAYMEIEFTSEEESNAYVTPDWVIKEVTDDSRYKNGKLARYGIPDPQ